MSNERERYLTDAEKYKLSPQQLEVINSKIKSHDKKSKLVWEDVAQDKGRSHE